MAVISYLNSFPAPNGVDILTDDGRHEVLRIDGSASLDACFSDLQRAHAYQCVGARDEVPQGLLVDAEFIGKAPDLLVCSASGSGVDVFDIEACTAAGVLVVNQAGANAESVAEHALSMMISVRKKIQHADRLLRKGYDGPRSEFNGYDLLERTVGIVGFGNIGKRLGEILHTAFRCKVLVYDPFIDAQTISAHHGEKVDFDTLLAASDIISVHTPLTADTAQMFNADAFAAMKPGSVFVITARGGIHDEDALADALESGHLGGAGLDVWEIEPPAANHRLLQFDNVISSPHVAGGTYDSLANMARYAATQLIDIFDGKPAPRPINPQVLPEFNKRLYKVIS